MQTLPIQPDRSTSKATKARVLTAEFGDGYTQRAGDGIHVLRDEISLSWPALDTTSANTLISFFEQHEGYQAFLWTPFRESTPKKYTCEEWSESYPGNNLTTVSATFKQQFDEGAI
jgi:phage-related protein